MPRVRVRPGQAVGQHRRLPPAWRHQADQLAVVLGALADGMDTRGRRGQSVVDQDSPVDVDARRHGRLDPGADPDGEDDGVSRQDAPIVQHDGLSPGIAVQDGLHTPGHHRDARRLDGPADEGTGHRVDLGVEQRVVRVDHRHAVAKVVQHLGHFQPEQASTDHHHVPRGPDAYGIGPQGETVFHGAEGVHAPDDGPLAVAQPGDRRHDSSAARRQDSDVVADPLTVADVGLPGAGVETPHPPAAGQPDSLLGIPCRILGRHVPRGRPGEDMRQQDPVVGDSGLFADDGHVERPQRVAHCQFVEQAVRRHSISDDQQPSPPAAACPHTRCRRGCGQHLVASATVTCTAQTLNSGIRLVGSSAGLVSRLAAWRPPQWNGAKTVSVRMSGSTTVEKVTVPRRL